MKDDTLTPPISQGNQGLVGSHTIFHKKLVPSLPNTRTHRAARSGRAYQD